VKHVISYDVTIYSLTAYATPCSRTWLLQPVLHVICMSIVTSPCWYTWNTKWLKNTTTIIGVLLL